MWPAWSLVTVDRGAAADRHSLVDRDALPLNAPKLRQHRFRRRDMAGGLQSLAYHAVQDQGYEADAGVSTDAFGQTVEHGRNLNLRLQHHEAQFDVSQALVSVNDLGGRQIGHIGDQ